MMMILYLWFDDRSIRLKVFIYAQAGGYGEFVKDLEDRKFPGVLEIGVLCRLYIYLFMTKLNYKVSLFY